MQSTFLRLQESHVGQGSVCKEAMVHLNQVKPCLMRRQGEGTKGWWEASELCKYWLHLLTRPERPNRYHDAYLAAASPLTALFVLTHTPRVYTARLVLDVRAVGGGFGTLRRGRFQRAQALPFVTSQEQQEPGPDWADWPGTRGLALTFRLTCCCHRRVCIRNKPTRCQPQDGPKQQKQQQQQPCLLSAITIHCNSKAAHLVSPPPPPLLATCPTPAIFPTWWTQLAWTLETVVFPFE